MEIGPITPAQAADKVLAAWLAVREALEAPLPTAETLSVPAGGAAQMPDGIHGEHELTRPVSEPALPGADTDDSHEAATVQTVWRAPTPAADVPHAGETTKSTTPAAQTELAVPGAQLVPAMLTGLLVGPASGWPQLPPAPTWLQDPAAHERWQQPRQQHDEHAQQPDDEQPEVAPGPATREQGSDHSDKVTYAADASAWCDALTRALRTALSARIVPQPLLAAADQWQRGRCVALACPQGDDPAGPAWAFVLWPHPAVKPAIGGVAPALALHGLRVEARLQWSAPPRAGQWCHVRVVKEHHPRTGRQLVALDDAAAASGRPVPCEVQLGPVLARSLRWCEVCVRIQAAQRFWAALGAQWSVHVVVCAEPLIAPPAAIHGRPPC